MTASRDLAAPDSAADERRAKAKAARKAKKDAEDLCATKYIADTVVFKEEHILEAASGLVDPDQKTSGAARTKKKREAPAPVAREPWQKN